jgi:ABC-type nitrate/sulfonate/bicarbonate transport system permease component
MMIGDTKIIPKVNYSSNFDDLELHSKYGTMDQKKRRNTWEIFGHALIVLWAFFIGYVMALGFGVLGISWSTWSVTLHFQEGGMTGPLFIELLNIARLAFIILTVVLLLYSLASLMTEET